MLSWIAMIATPRSIDREGCPANMLTSWFMALGCVHVPGRAHCWQTRMRNSVTKALRSHLCGYLLRFVCMLLRFARCVCCVWLRVACFSDPLSQDVGALRMPPHRSSYMGRDCRRAGRASRSAQVAAHFCARPEGCKEASATRRYRCGGATAWRPVFTQHTLSLPHSPPVHVCEVFNRSGAFPRAAFHRICLLVDSSIARGAGGYNRTAASDPFSSRAGLSGLQQLAVALPGMPSPSTALPRLTQPLHIA